jgi:hypothetical protein
LDVTEGSIRRSRVVVLAPPSLSLSISTDLSAAPPAELVRCASGYEAAAELLVDRPAVLVMELSRITAPHVGLLRLAGRLGVPVLACGTICADLGKDVLTHLRLVGAPQLEAALAEMLASTPAPVPTAPAVPATEGQYAPQPEEIARPAAPPAQPDQANAPPAPKLPARLAPIRQAAPPSTARNGDVNQTP